MTWWLVTGAVLLAVAVLAGIAMTLMGRVRPLMLALRRLQLRGEEAQRLQAKVIDLQERAEQVQDRAQAIAAWRHGGPDPTPAAEPISDAR